MANSTATTASRLSTDRVDLDRAIAKLHSQREIWAQTSIAQRLEYLQSCLDRTVAVAEAWTIAACQANNRSDTRPKKLISLKSH